MLTNLCVHEKTKSMISRCTGDDFETMYSIINEAGGSYNGVIPAARWKVLHMSQDELSCVLREEVALGGYERDENPTDIIGMQQAGDIRLISPVNIRTEQANRGIFKLLNYLLKLITTSILIVMWTYAALAVSFYKKYRFQRVSAEKKNRLLKKDRAISEPQVETSVVIGSPEVAGSGDK